ncbi:hypothetical protein GSH19_02180 [Lactobacillus sp. S2-2]|nr:hypothetical protein [Lactobacillus sp. S2-2]MCF6514971.1 hypothetical protein [Lactobacillus sp. S2-2]
MNNNFFRFFIFFLVAINIILINSNVSLLSTTNEIISLDVWFITIEL